MYAGFNLNGAQSLFQAIYAKKMKPSKKLEASDINTEEKTLDLKTVDQNKKGKICATFTGLNKVIFSGKGISIPLIKTKYSRSPKNKKTLKTWDNKNVEELIQENLKLRKEQKETNIKNLEIIAEIKKCREQRGEDESYEDTITREDALINIQDEIVDNIEMSSSKPKTVSKKAKSKMARMGIGAMIGCSFVLGCFILYKKKSGKQARAKKVEEERQAKQTKANKKTN